MIKGFATPEGTQRFRTRFQNQKDAFFYRQRQNLWFSTIGIGSYLGEPDEETDALYEASLKESVLSGVNVIDSAINYRAQRSERSFGRAIASLIRDKKIQRDEIIVSTKGGFIPFDGGYPADSRSFIEEEYLSKGILSAEDVIQGCHAMTPLYLEDQLGRSLTNLGLETLDIYYLHNPETQLGEIPRPEFLNRMRKAFEWLESKVKEGKIRTYGTATWNGYRVSPQAPDYLSLEELNCIAREAAGAEHHFKVIQLPFNLAMPEAWVSANQSFGANYVPLLQIAEKYSMIVMGSGSLLQSRLTGPLPDFLEPHFKNLPQSAQKALQFARSAAGMTTALVGMKQTAHVHENLEVSKVPPLNEPQMAALFQRT